MIDWIKTIAEGFILEHGYLGVFLSTTFEQFILPIPADFYLGFAVDSGLNFLSVMLLVFLGTTIGSSIGYLLGKHLGHPALKWLAGQRKINKGEQFIKKWGMWGVIGAGITPFPFIIITWTAGIFEMKYWRFILAVIIGRIPRYFLTAYAGMRFFESQFYSSSEMSAMILGLIQGITEFLPISSSGHLVISEHFLKIPMETSQLFTFDIFLHGASLLAIVLYFWRDWWEVLKELFGMLKKRNLDTDSMAFKLAIATIPAIIAALLLEDLISNYLRNLKSIAIFFILVGLLFFYTSQRGHWNFRKKVSLKKAIIIGCAQALALIPGVSRAGSTIATGTLLGLKREHAARFSFMLGGIAILAANVYALISLSTGEAEWPKLSFLLAGSITTFISSLLAISFLLRFLKKNTLRPFGIYLVLAGITILSFF